LTFSEVETVRERVESGELLHLDVTIVRLLDGTKAYLHAVIDN
jgi:hypothetical protein